MKLSKEVETKLLSFVKEIFNDDKWDYAHTLSCVKIMKKLISSERGNERILIPVMYLHDIGYAGQLKDGYTLEERIKVKETHMILGAKKAKDFLSTLGFSLKEVEKICHLIKVHDDLVSEKSFEERLVIEADSLGQIDPLVGNNFGEGEFARYVKIFERKRVPLFVTSTGKEMLGEFARENELFQKYTKLFKK